MKVFSLFTGIGGFELGFQQAYEDLRPIQQNIPQRPRKQHDIKNKSFKWECVGYSEIDKYAIQIYEKHYQSKNYGDITKIDEQRMPDFDLLCGGFPCQSFSIAGKRGGFEDTRGTLFFDIARIAKHKRPRILFLENVKGLLSHDEGRTFNTIITTLDELGYDLQWQVLNSKNFGVPQNRERVFIIGHLRGTPRPKVFPIGTDDRENVGFQPEEDRQRTRFQSRYSATLNTRYGQRWSGETYIHQLNNPTHSNDRIYGEDGISPTLNTAQGGNRQPKIQAVLTPDRLTKRQNGRRMKEHNEPSFTLTGQDKHGVAVDNKIRRLTPTECERLQGFPDGWTEGISDTQRYKCLGNAVTVNVIKEIAIRLLDYP